MTAATPPAIPTPEEVDGFVARTYPAAAAQGFRCESMSQGQALARWIHDPTTLRPGGLISGPTQFALADLALWFLTFTVLGLAPMAVTSELYIVYVRPAVGGDLMARAELLRAGKTTIKGTVKLWIDGAPDKIVSHATGSYIQIV